MYMLSMAKPLTDTKCNKSMTRNNTVSINYSDEKLRILVEEYIIQQRKDFTFKGLCSYILYWSMEDNQALYDSYQMTAPDSERVNRILDSIVKDGRLVKEYDHYQLLNS